MANKFSAADVMAGAMATRVDESQVEKVLNGAPVAAPEQETAAEQTAQEPVQEAAAIKVRKRRPGGGRKKNTGPAGRQLTIILDEQLVDKARYISLNEDVLLKDLIEKGLGDVVAKWEKKNGVINLPKWTKKQQA